jgi:TRAP-type C4-dicarboxylate transport system permease small subunit
MMRPLQSALATIERVVTSIAVICLLAIMLIVVADVFMRYVVNRPFSFTYDLVGLYLNSRPCQRRHPGASIFAVGAAAV